MDRDEVASAQNRFIVCSSRSWTLGGEWYTLRRPHLVLAMETRRQEGNETHDEREGAATLEG